MFLSRKRIRRLLGIVNQSKKKYNKQKSKNKVGRTFRKRRRDINLRNRSLKHNRKQKNIINISGGRQKLSGRKSSDKNQRQIKDESMGGAREARKKKGKKEEK